MRSFLQSFWLQIGLVEVIDMVDMPITVESLLEYVNHPKWDALPPFFMFLNYIDLIGGLTLNVIPGIQVYNVGYKSCDN